MLKKWIVSLLLILAFCSSTSLIAQDVKDAYVAPALQQDGGWTMVVIPDPQAYTRYGRNQGVFELMTAWIAENKETLNIDWVREQWESPLESVFPVRTADAEGIVEPAAQKAPGKAPVYEGPALKVARPKVGGEEFSIFSPSVEKLDFPNRNMILCPTLSA